MEFTRNVSTQKEAMPTAKTHKSHKVQLDNHKQLCVTGVTAVPVFNDKNMTIKLDNENLIVTGQDLDIQSLDIENGKLVVNGYVTSLKYTNTTTPASVIKKVFK